jgi:predicted nucleic acid-binding protein
VSVLATAVLVDSNVLVDLITEDPVWYAWSSAEIEKAADRGYLVINPLIYAEFSVGSDRIEDLDDALAPDVFVCMPLPWDAAFLAGKCFRAYRRAGGVRHSPMPDLYIGAHAAVAGMALLTRDPSRYRTHFPKLELIDPD